MFLENSLATLAPSSASSPNKSFIISSHESIFVCFFLFFSIICHFCLFVCVRVCVCVWVCRVNVEFFFDVFLKKKETQKQETLTFGDHFWARVLEPC